MKKIVYQTQGTCSKFIELEEDDNGILTHANVIGGCNGNLKGICSLVTGMNTADIMKKLDGIRCGNKETSCPDQLCRAIEAMERQ